MLRDRLNGLVERLDQCLVSEFMFDPNEWVKRAVKARNNLTHEGRTSSHSIEELAAIVEITKIVVILICFVNSKFLLIGSVTWCEDTLGSEGSSRRPGNGCLVHRAGHLVMN